MEQVSNEIRGAHDLPPAKAPVGWFEGNVPARGHILGMGDVKALYQQLSVINRKFGEGVIATLPKDTKMSDEEWERYKAFLLEDAFCLTVSIFGDRDQQLYGENAEAFDSDNLPHPIRKIYFNNVTAWAAPRAEQQPSELD